MDSHNRQIRSDLFAIIFFILISAFLISCSSKRRGDGPPNFYVDETRIKNAVPKVEPLAKYGNMNVYRVKGKFYRVMQSNKNYEAVGTASWYGTLFDKRRTSSGEPYDMLGMTAAHKTLPLPTYVEVTNLVNQRKIIVKVNDRGPFSGNRLIDLSYVAAKKLGMLGRGTTMVKIKAIDPLNYGKTLLIANDTPKPRGPTYTQLLKNIKVEESVAQTRTHTIKTPTAQITHRKQTTVTQQKAFQFVYLQVGAFRSRVNAVRLQQRMANLFSAPVVISNPNGDKLYRVQIGPIKDLSTAEKITLRLKGLGIRPNKTLGV